MIPGCSDCDGRCCRWILLDYNEETEEVSVLRGAVVVKVAGKKTLFAFRRECMMLTEGGRCSIYEKRPLFCRENPNDGGFICRLTYLLERYHSSSDSERILKID